MSVTLLEVMAAARSRAASLVAEVAGYLVLGTADQVLGAARTLDAGGVVLSEEGALGLVAGAAASDEQAEAALRTLLGGLLEQASSVTPALLRASRRPAGDGTGALVRELEAALIPVNRAAARRAMSRLYRDVVRAKERGRLAPLPAAVERLPPPVVEESLPLPEVVVELAVDDEPDASDAIVGLTEDDFVELVEETATAPEPVVARRSQPAAAVPEVPDLELPVYVSPLPPVAAVDRAPVEEPLELEGAEATDRAPELTPELTARVEVTAALPEPAEVTVPLPPAPTPAPPPAPAPAPPPAWTEADVDVFVALEAPTAADVLAFEPPPFDPSRVVPPPEPEPAVSPIEPVPVVALEALVEAPSRPRPLIAAPPRYAPRASDVDALVAGFAVSDADSAPGLCADLKSLAGVDRTELPPAVATATPPPVAVDDSPAEARAPKRRPRIGLGALVGMLAVGGVAAAASTFAPTALDPAAAATAPRQQATPACSATLVVRGVSERAQAMVRAATRREARSPDRVEDSAAIFTGLRCREPLEVTVASPTPGSRRWVRIPVSAEAMTPSDSNPAEVRVAVTSSTASGGD